MAVCKASRVTDNFLNRMNVSVKSKAEKAHSHDLAQLQRVIGDLDNLHRALMQLLEWAPPLPNVLLERLRAQAETTPDTVILSPLYWVRAAKDNPNMQELLGISSPSAAAGPG